MIQATPTPTQPPHQANGQGLAAAEAVTTPAAAYRGLAAVVGHQHDVVGITVGDNDAASHLQNIHGALDALQRVTGAAP
jgi:hypothetical protein